MAVDAVFHETSAEHRVESVPFAHLSIELGHLYMEEFAAGPEALRRNFRKVAPWAAAARQACAMSVPNKQPRISTCFLIDDYFSRFGSPREVIPQLVDAAREADLEIDYVGRESACAQADGVSLAALVQGRLVDEPPPGTTGKRPPVTQSGWLCNGERSASSISTQAEAMSQITPWRPPAENAAERHSIFIDTELWKDRSDGSRLWSCPFLAAVWQLLRLGLIRDTGRAVAQPKLWTAERGELPKDWDELPPIVKLNPTAPSFTAYSTYTVLAGSFLPVEHAVRTILSQVAIEDAVAQQVFDRARGDRLTLPIAPVDRIGYAFLPH
jgi:hypothetical protein